MNREEKRKSERVINKVIKNAKIDMEDWLMTLQHEPTPNELIAFKAGYISGINRNTKKD